MNSNIKTSIGLLIPLLSIIVFFIAVFSGNNIAAIFVPIGGLLTWFLYSSIMRSELPDVTGNIIVLFGFLLSSAFFLNYGLTINMFGGYELNPEGAAISSTLLFLVVLLGINYRNRVPLAVAKNITTGNDSITTDKTPEDTVSIDDEDYMPYDDDYVSYDDDYDYDYDYDLEEK